MEKVELYHHGIKGMKWGIRRTPAQLARARGKIPSEKETKQTVSKKQSSPQKKSISELSDDEIRSKINRLELEKRYQDLLKSTTPPKSTRGRDFVMRVLERSGENIATQLTTDVMGKAVNATIGKLLNDPNLVNPKKGQKDK